MTQDICPECDEQQWSLMDKNYLRIYGHCWHCDKIKWESGELPLMVFEEREKTALETC